MKESLEKKWKKLDIYINDFGQGIAINAEGTQEQIRFIHDFREYLGSRQQVAYIDFAKITDAKRLAIEFIEQYELLSGMTLDYDMSEEDYRLLDLAIKYFSEEMDAERVVIWLDNFTEILKMKESEWLFGMLRGYFQHQQNITHVFTSDNKDALNQIFLDYKNPFFRFAVKIDL
ncbi:MAG: hypothetical protein PHO65_01400 [Sulfurovum sp.]|nr:hypothetical protein [Sulfurovum sp.]